MIILLELAAMSLFSMLITRGIRNQLAYSHSNFMPFTDESDKSMPSEPRGDHSIGISNDEFFQGNKESPRHNSS